MKNFPTLQQNQVLSTYFAHCDERQNLGIPPLPLNKIQTQTICDLLSETNNDLNINESETNFLIDLLKNRIPAGVDDAAKIKAKFLSQIANKQIQCKNSKISRLDAIFLLGTMLGGFNVQPLVNLLSDNNEEIAQAAADALKNTLLIYNAFYDICELSKNGNNYATSVLKSWANAEWFVNRPAIKKEIKLTVFRVAGETNTDDLSPAPDAWSRPDIPLHALAMLKNPRPDGVIIPDENGVRGPIKQILELQKKGNPLVYVGDVVGTGSSRKSATNSVLWFIGENIPFVPNKKMGGVCLGSKIAPIFYNTMEDAGALPVEINVDDLKMGDEIVLKISENSENSEKNNRILVEIFKNDNKVAESCLKTAVLLDEVRAGGRINLIIGRALTAKSREFLQMSSLQDANIFTLPSSEQNKQNIGFTLAQKIVGKACGLAKNQGILPGTYCEPKMTTVGSQDTTGPMTRDELKDLACLGFSADLVMQSFCHTAAYPKLVDVKMHRELPIFMKTRGGVSLKPGDGVIHSWLNRLCLPDTVGTGGDSHTRFPIGLSFPAGSGLVAFAAATGSMPLDMPESVLVKFSGDFDKAAAERGITLRDLVNAIPYFAIKQGLLTVEKKNKKNIFSGRILEIQGLPNLKVEQAFELTDASAERSAAACSVALNKEPIVEYLNSNITLMKYMLAQGYKDENTLKRRIAAMQDWIANGELLVADDNAEYAAVIEINVDEINEPILACPNDPDDVKMLSEVQGDKIDEVFIGSCMTNIGHFRAASEILGFYNSKNDLDLPTRLWIAPPTKMDAMILNEEGFYNVFGKVGARIEMPGCSLCMGNQAQIKRGSTAVSTSTRNFPNRLGLDTRVYLASAELSALSAVLGKLPNVSEYRSAMQSVQKNSANIYRYMNFDKIAEFVEIANSAANV